MVQFHFATFYNPKTRSINCMAVHKSKLALSRFDNSIEIWNIKYTPFMERLVPSTLEQNIQGLTWCGDQLFSCDLEGFLNEYDLHLLKTKQKLSVTGEAAYCLDTDKGNVHIAVGTDQGYINIFSIFDGEVTFEKFLDKQEGKVLCLKYDTTSNYIVTGSIDVIRIFDVKQGHALHKMSTGRSEKNKPTITWCLEVINDFVIITGDSRGKLTFWDGKVGAQVESYQSHDADILAIAISKNEDTLFCTGVDPVISSFSKVNIKDQTYKWVKNIQRRVHDHDVKALALYKNHLYSGGIDGYLALTYHPPKTLVKYPPFLQNNCVWTSSSRLLLLQHTDHLEVWKLGDAENTPNCNHTYKIKNIPKKLITIEKQVKTSLGQKEKQFIICSAMSKSGKWIVYSTRNFVNLLKLNMVNMEVQLISTKLTNICEACTRLGFSSDSKELFLATIDRNIIVYNLEEKSIVSKLDIKSDTTDCITHMAISNLFLVISDIAGNIVIFRKRKSWHIMHKLPKYRCITSIAINEKCLVIAYSDNKIAEYLLEQEMFSTFSSLFDNTTLNRYRNKHFPIRNITFDKTNKSIVVLHDDGAIVVIDKDKTSIDEPQLKTAKLDDELPESIGGVSSFKEQQHLVHVECISENEYVAVKVNPISVLNGLPPCFRKATFGDK